MSVDYIVDGGGGDDGGEGVVDVCGRDGRLITGGGALCGDCSRLIAGGGDGRDGVDRDCDGDIVSVDSVADDGVGVVVLKVLVMFAVAVIK